MDKLDFCIYLLNSGSNSSTIPELIETGIPGYHTLVLPEPTIRISLLSGFKRIAISPSLNENILSVKILSLLFPNFSIFAGLI